MVKKNVFELSFLLFCIAMMIGCQKKEPLKYPVEFTFLPCGDADIALIQDDKHTILIDTGESICKEDVLSYLEQKEIENIDVMILTHPDKDHIGNAVSIMEKWNVKRVIASSYQKGSELEEELLSYVKNQNVLYDTLKKNLNIKIGEIEILIEPPNKEYGSSNNSSLVSWVKIGNITVFFGADIKRKRIDEMLNGNLSLATIVKIPYHGRYISNMELLLKKLYPEFVIVTSETVDPQTEQLLQRLNIHYDVTIDPIVIETDGIDWKRKIVK